MVNFGFSWTYDDSLSDPGRTGIPLHTVYGNLGIPTES